VRVVVKERSYATLIGFVVIVGAIGGLIFLLRKIGRR